MKQKSGFFVFIAIVSIGALFVADRAFDLTLGEKIGRVLKPVGIVFDDFGQNSANFFGGIKNIGNLQRENNELKDKLNKSLVEIAKLSEAQKENAALKRDLGFLDNNNYDLVAAKVVFFDPSNIRDTITINAGRGEGIKEGNVVVSEGFLVGKVVDLSDHSSKIKLISDPDSAVPAAISTSSVTGIVKGRIGNGLNMEQVPQSEKVNMDELVVTSGLGGEFPKGIVIGKVDEVQKISGSIFQQITIRPMVDLTKLERVMIIRQ